MTTLNPSEATSLALNTLTSQQLEQHKEAA